MVRKREVFLTERVKKKTMQFRVDPRIDSLLEQLDERIAKEAPGQNFDRHAVVESALQKAIADTNAELDARARRSAQVGGTDRSLGTVASAK